MSEPTTIDFRVNEAQTIIDDLKAVADRIAAHQTYLTDPVLLPTHKTDVRNHDVVLANLTLAKINAEDAVRQMGIALKVTNDSMPDPAPAPAPTPESEPDPVP